MTPDQLWEGYRTGGVIFLLFVAITLGIVAIVRKVFVPGWTLEKTESECAEWKALAQGQQGTLDKLITLGERQERHIENLTADVRANRDRCESLNTSINQTQDRMTASFDRLNEKFDRVLATLERLTYPAR